MNGGASGDKPVDAPAYKGSDHRHVRLRPLARVRVPAEEPPGRLGGPLVPGPVREYRPYEDSEGIFGPVFAYLPEGGRFPCPKRPAHEFQEGDQVYGERDFRIPAFLLLEGALAILDGQGVAVFPAALRHHVLDNGVNALGFIRLEVLLHGLEHPVQNLVDSCGWLEYFAERAKCPKCGSRLHLKGDKLVSDCGYEVRMK